MVSVPEHNTIPSVNTPQSPGNVELPFNCLEAAIEAKPPAVIHQVMVNSVGLKVYPEAAADKRQIKPAAIICVDFVYTIERFKDIVPDL
jgi:hypothetical protein